jgi:hypothetical protein
VITQLQLINTIIIIIIIIIKYIYLLTSQYRGCLYIFEVTQVIMKVTGVVNLTKRQCTYDVTIRRVNVTTVAVEN